MSEPATAYQAIKGEGGEPQLGEGGEFILPEGGSPPVVPPPPPMPVVITLCPGVECCDLSPFVYTVRRAAPTLTATGGAGGTPLCSTCLNEAYSTTIVATGIGPALTWTIDSGALPTGLVFHGGYNEDGQVLIDGTPTIGGNYSITVKATSPTGAFVTTVFPFNVFGITTTSLPDYTVGDPYSFQLVAAGGSGNYGWSISSGALPDGIFLDPNTGIISGTPTGINAGTMPIIFKVVDITCEEFNPVFVPRVSLVTSSNTTIATLYGWDEYPGHVSSPPKKYHNLTWSGTSEQVAFHRAGIESVPTCDGQISDARYIYSGTATIDAHGVQTSFYRKDLYTACPASSFTPPFDTNVISFPFVIQGYCWPPDPNSCGTCNYPAFTYPITDFDLSQMVLDPAFDWNTSFIPQFKANRQGNNTLDIPAELINATIYVTTATTLDNVGSFKDLLLLQVGGTGSATNVPPTNYPINGIDGPWLRVYAKNDFHAVLTDEYTDAEALANAIQFISDSRKAENFPRTTGFVSRWTTVNFDLNASELVPGLQYTITVTYLDSDFTQTTRLFTFTATATTHTINDEVPTPAAGHTLTILQPTIAAL